MTSPRFTSRTQSQLAERRGPTGVTSEPLVIGVIGSGDRSELVLTADMSDLTCVVDVPGLQLHTSGPIRHQRTRDGAIHTWAALDPVTSFTDPRSAREEAGAIGAAVDQNTGTVELFGDALGIWPLFYLDKEDLVLFSNRLDPLLPLCERPALDRISWAALASLRYAPPGRSVVEDIHTLAHGESITFDPNGEGIEHEISPPALEPDNDADTEDLIRAIQTVLAPIEGGTLFLSGGFDSRLLAACAVDAGIDITCLATDAYVGDVSVAQAVASELDIPLAEATRDSSDWLAEFTQMAHRLDYATTLGPWSMQLGTVARSLTRPAIGGIGGGLLLNSHMQTTDSSHNGLSARTMRWAASVEQVSIGRNTLPVGSSTPAMSLPTTSWRPLLHTLNDQTGKL